MRRRATAAGGGRAQPFPEELLDLPLPLSPEHEELVARARAAAGWGIVRYLQARIERRHSMFSAPTSSND